MHCSLPKIASLQSITYVLYQSSLTHIGSLLFFLQIVTHFSLIISTLHGINLWCIFRCQFHKCNLELQNKTYFYPLWDDLVRREKNRKKKKKASVGIFAFLPRIKIDVELYINFDWVFCYYLAKSVTLNWRCLHTLTRIQYEFRLSKFIT